MRGERRGAMELKLKTRRKRHKKQVEKKRVYLCGCRFSPAV